MLFVYLYLFKDIVSCGTAEQLLQFY